MCFEFEALYWANLAEEEEKGKRPRRDARLRNPSRRDNRYSTKPRLRPESVRVCVSPTSRKRGILFQGRMRQEGFIHLCALKGYSDALRTQGICVSVVKNYPGIRWWRI